MYRRNSDSDIVPSSSGDAKTIDPDTKKVTVAVAWGSEEGTELVFEDGLVDDDLANFPSDNAGDGDPVQSFELLSDATISSVDLYLARASSTSPSDVYLEIRSGSAVGAVVASSTALQASGFDGSLSWINFPLVSNVDLSGGTEYFLRLRSTPDSTQAFSGSEGTIHWGYGQSASSPYEDGTARRYVGRLGNSSDQGQALTQYDFSFRLNATGFAGEIESVTYLTNLFEYE